MIKAISTCASGGKRLRFWTFTDAFESFRRFCRVVKAISYVASTDTNTTSDQWSYLHKNNIYRYFFNFKTCTV